MIDLRKEIEDHFKGCGLITPDGKLTLRKDSDYDARIMVDQIKQLIEKREGKLKPFIDHDPMCETIQMAGTKWGDNCTCGLKRIL